MGIWFLTVRPLHCYHHHHHDNNDHHAIVMIAKIIKIIIRSMITIMRSMKTIEAMVSLRNYIHYDKSEI